MIVVKSLNYSYNNQRYFQYPDFTCEKGEEVLITGMSGCGKTTLLHIMGGLLRNYNGDLCINGMQLSKLGTQALDRFRRSNIGIVFQTSHLIASLNVKQNIAVAATDKKLNQLEMLTELLGIEQLLYRMPSSLSQGEKQRVSIVRALINNPAVLLADEPTSSLDDAHAATVIDLLRSLCRKTNSTLAIVTHDQRVKEKIFNTVVLP